MLKHIDLFSGIGGFALAASWTGLLQTTVFCESAKTPQRVLKKNFPQVPIVDDIAKFDGRRHKDAFIISAGYPCQPFSLRGQRKGKADDRDKWAEAFRVISEARPAWVICENVVGHITLGLEKVLLDLDGANYLSQCFIIPASSVNAPHQRERLWIVAHTKRLQQRRQKQCGWKAGRMGGHTQPPAWDETWQDSLRRLRRMDDGLSYRVDRLDGIRNAIVPQVAYAIFDTILKTERLADGHRPPL
jgi:DNA (cytosine-5)-methyltransferase 1